MYGATSLVALALLGRLEAVSVLPAELRGTFGIAPLGGQAMCDAALAIGGGSVLGGAAVALGTWVGSQRGGPKGGAGAVALAAAVLVAAPVAALPPRQPDVLAQLAAGGTLPVFCAAWTRRVAP